MSPRDSFNECTDVLFVYLANGNEDSRYCGSYAINPIIQLKGSTSRVKIEATEWQPRHIMAMRVTAEARKYSNTINYYRIFNF